MTDCLMYDVYLVVIEDGLGILFEQLIADPKVSKRICLLVSVTVKRGKCSYIHTLTCSILILRRIIIVGISKKKKTALISTYTFPNCSSKPKCCSK